MHSKYCWTKKVLSPASPFLSLAQIWWASHCRGFGITLKATRFISGAGGGISFPRSTWLHTHLNKNCSVRKENKGRGVGWTSTNVSTASSRPFWDLSVDFCALPASCQSVFYWPSRIAKTFPLECWEGMKPGGGTVEVRKLTSEKQWKTPLTSHKTICKMRKSHTHPRLQNQKC